MEQNENLYVYQDENGGQDDQMYIIADDGNINIENFQDFNIAPEGAQNVLPLGGGECEISEMNGEQYLYYDESGQAYIIDPTNNETSAVDFINENNDPNNRVITYNCPLCPQVYQNANAFTKHTREKHFVKVFTCRQCEQFFDNLSLLFLHARRTHVDPRKPGKNPSSFKFHCPDCNYMTNNGGTMEHHRRAHSGIKPYKCDICDKSFAQKANMKTHKNRHIHKDRIFRCDTCSKSFNSHDIYLAHLRTREHELQEHFQMILTSKVQIQCLGCNLEFNSYYDVNKHSRSCDVLRDLTNKFWCIPCEMSFATSMSLKHHLKTHGGNQVISCPVCGERGFPGFNQLNHHITRAHSLKVNRRNVCRYCEMTFETKDMLLSHIEDMHVSEKNARQSRGAAGRLRCRYDQCDFTSNSVMLMDRHHDQHVNNTLPSTTTIRKAVKRPRKPRFDLQEMAKEEMLLDDEIERMHATIEENEILRGADDDHLEFDEDGVKLEMLDTEDTGLARFHRNNALEDTELDFLTKLATTYMEGPKSHPTDVKRKRGRPRKLPQKSTDLNSTIKEEGDLCVSEKVGSLLDSHDAVSTNQNDNID